MNDGERWADVIFLIALASRMDGEGRYSIAKLLRSAADAIAWCAAYERKISGEKEHLLQEIDQAVEITLKHGLNPDLVSALRYGKQTYDYAAGQLPKFANLPHPYVCRTCGHLEIHQPPKCSMCGAWGVTFRQYLPVYWLNDLEPFAAMERLRQSQRDLEMLLSGIADEAIRQVPSEEDWSVYHAMTHLRDAQNVLRTRLKLMLEQANPILSTLPVFDWATHEQAEPPTWQQLFDEYSTTRKELLDQLRLIPLADWWRTGHHEEFGPVTIRQQVSYFAAHESTHLPQIERLLSLSAG